MSAEGPGPAPASSAPAGLERARGRVSLTIAQRDGRSTVAGLAQAGCGRLLFPTVAATAPLEAVVVNTGGGLTGGDSFAVSIHVGHRASAVVTTQACERIYRSDGATAEVDVEVALGTGARLDWLPQETILFDRSRLARRLSVTMAADATLLVVEAVLLGRRASGERFDSGLFRDRWRIRRGERLLFAEAFALDGAAEGPATLGGAAAFATVLLVAPNAAARLESARGLIASSPAEIGLSAFDGLCVGRLIAQDGARLRRGLVPLIDRLGGRVPLVWSL